MIEIVIPISMIPIEIIFSVFFITTGVLWIFAFRGCLQLVMLGILCICLGFICLFQYMLFFMVIPSMPSIPNITLPEFPISVKVI